MTNVKVGDQLEVVVKRLGINAEGIAYEQRLAIFIDEALPGEVVKIEITQVFEKYAVAKIIEIIKASDHRLPIEYPDLQACGAFGMQHVTYEYLLVQTRFILIDALKRYLQEDKLNHLVKSIVHLEPLGYRNKVSMPVRRIEGSNKFGYYKIGTTDFISANFSPVHHPRINEITQYLEELLNYYRLDGYIAKEKSGYLKSVVIRRTHYHGEIQVSFLLMKKFAEINKVISDLTNKFSDIKSVYAFYTDDYKQQVFFTNDYEKLFGKETINEKLNQQTFSLFPESFWQLNTPVAQSFYQKIVELAKLKESDIVIDAYAGSAIISHYIAKYVKKVYAIEIDQKSVQSAIRSLKTNNINNVTVLQSDFKKALKNLINEKIDVMIFDPARPGLGQECIKEILKFKPTKIVYGSCNPSTLAKDLSLLTPAYKIEQVIPFDMFPHTPLVESITVLTLKG